MRLMLLKISPEMLVTLCIEGSEHHFRTLRGFPADAKCVGAGYDEHSRSLVVQVESEAFNEVPDGHKIPLFDPPPSFKDIRKTLSTHHD